MTPAVTVVGGGLAGVEAAVQLARRGIAVELVEMRPLVVTEAHSSGFLAEMVCSNSLGARELTSASGLLKEELRRLGSFFLQVAERFAVPAGNSLSVDRLRLAEYIDAELGGMAGVSVSRRELCEIPVGDRPLVIATGPLTSSRFAAALTSVTMRRNLFFFDATCPLIRAESIDFTKLFAASRYEKGGADFWNIPLDEGLYAEFVAQLVAAATAEVHEFDRHRLFDACQPVEEIARSGEKSLAFGPLKPVGLTDPRSGRLPAAVAQLRQDDLHRHFFQLVGFQTRLTWGEQKRVFRMLPGLERAEFERYGRMHRNTYVNAPLILNERGQSRTRPHIWFAGQISGVEGYVESVCSGLLAGRFVAARLGGRELPPPPPASACGALLHTISHAGWKDFRPTKFSFGLLPDDGLERMHHKKRKKELKAERALDSLEKWMKNSGC